MKSNLRLFFTTFIMFCFLFSCKEGSNEDRIRIGFSQAMAKDDWRRSMNNSMQLQASLNPNIMLTIRDANYEVQKQIDQIDAFIADSVDILIISPIQSKPITPVVRKALDAGIPVLVVDRKTENENYTAYLGADNIEVGRNAAKEIIASNTQERLRIVEIQGMLGSSPAEERTIGFNQVIGQYKNVSIVERIEGDWEKESILEKFRTFLKNGGRTDYVFAHNDRMAAGAWEVARELGLENTIAFVGVDGLNGLDGGIQMVEDGILKATVLYPTGGDEAIKFALRILNNEPVSKNNILSTTVINEVNADIMKNQFDKINEQRIEIEAQLAAIREQQELYYSQSNLLKVTMALLAIILSLAIYSVYSIFAIQKKNRQLELTNKKITVQRNQIEKIAVEVKESNEAKLNFFTGLSHEFKTPLTLIMSSVESMGDNTRESGSKMMNEIELIHNNSNRLLRLINNLLDFRRVEDKNFNIRASKTNMYSFSKNIYNDFAREAKKRNIDFKVHANNEQLELFIDRNLMDKVYFNLLSNAFKFTPDNGKIEIYIADNLEGNGAEIQIKDNGIGIPAKEIDSVFEPFFKGSNNRKNSSGIGLHLSKQFVELHLGEIKVSSFKGTEFTIKLFKGKTHFNEDQVIDEPELVDAQLIDLSSEIVLEKPFFIEKTNSDADRFSILIIEDNKDLSFFLRSKLQSEYEILLSDGTDAMECAFDAIPDLILCDVNLPDKSGFEICELLKKDLRTSHIPVVILTALENKESYLKGLQSGADLYLTKPFSFSILNQSLKSLLYNREKLRFYYTNNIYKIEQTDAFGNLEQQFVNKLNELVKENLNNDDFSVENLAENLNISRVQLYRKVKAIMGISVSDYISNFRLEKAKAMLENTSLSISEIAYANGFSSPNYFSTSFKNRFGTSPVTYRKSI
ncbi:substrate-binding domain-containing protein [uncultured Kriegella sp.]|uniref:substrate-binding domain-containing protein n=1 Tax=uncultured Kriegella sp. TaxID=1798910 RepID=UPI0030DB7BBD|tara:strand:- start:65177 stop:67924 length:2748 start_codon:yes stop_codon:yes gene_type:complete